VLWIVIYELIFLACFWDHPSFWQLEARTGLIFSSLLGWLVGREIFHKPVMATGIDRFAKK